MSIRIVLAAARGYARRQHLGNIERLQAQGRLSLAGICERRPLQGPELNGLGGVRQDADFARLLDDTSPQIAIVSTPIHTHAQLALAAAERGVHLLLEKPPTASYAQYEQLLAGIRRAGIACQTGFQSLGSHALPAIRALLAEGAIGEVRGIGAAGAWVRDMTYYGRSPWAGRRRLDGRDVVDGVLTNPFAHAVATALALNGSPRAEDVDSVESELYRAYDIESDDTSCVRVSTAGGKRVTVAATLCAEQPADPYVAIHGSRGRITFRYTRDAVLLQRAGKGPQETFHGRTDLLENLLAHLACGEPLLAPLEETGAFMRVLEAVRTAPEPAPLPPPAWRQASGEGGADRRIVREIDGLVTAAAESLALYSELGAPWALPAQPCNT